jgi:hypothetical protein
VPLHAKKHRAGHHSALDNHKAGGSTRTLERASPRNLPERLRNSPQFDELCAVATSVANQCITGTPIAAEAFDN